MNNYKVCPQCGASVYKFDNYCGACGNRLADEIVDENYCPYCGGTVPSKETTCPNCGARRVRTRRQYPKNVQLRTCSSCKKRIPLKSKFCSCCGSAVTAASTKSAKTLKNNKGCFAIIGIASVSIFVILIIIGIVSENVERHNDEKRESQELIDNTSEYNEALTAEFAYYDVDEIVNDMNTANFDDNYKAKYKDKYICVTGIIADMGYSGQSILLEPLDDANLRFLSGKTLEWDFYDDYGGAAGETFSETYIKGDTVKIYGKVKYLYDTRFEVTAYWAEKVADASSGSSNTSSGTSA